MKKKAAHIPGMKRKAEKGKSYEFPLHSHDAIEHSHGHSHVTHYRTPGQRDEWKHLTVTHEHEHNHAAVSHLHTPHEELQIEHVHEAHVHDHSHPSN